MGEKTFRLTTILIIVFVISITETYAEIYKHIDKSGRTTYSNQAVSGANKLPTNPPFSKKNRNHSETAKKYPIVSSDAQAKRDLKRRQILENELATEKKLFVNAKQSLINAQKNAKVLNNNSPEGVTQYSKKIKNQKLLHERNITALRKELAN